MAYKVAYNVSGLDDAHTNKSSFIRIFKKCLLHNGRFIHIRLVVLYMPFFNYYKENISTNGIIESNAYLMFEMSDLNEIFDGNELFEEKNEYFRGWFYKTF